LSATILQRTARDGSRALDRGGKKA
jgi:hypothetical protein